MPILHVKAEGQDPVVRLIKISKNLVKPSKFFIGPENGKKLVHRDPNGAAAGRFGSFQNQAAILIETGKRVQKTMDSPSIGAALGIFIIKNLNSPSTSIGIQT